MKNSYDDKLNHIESWLQEAVGMDDASLQEMAAEINRELDQEKQAMTPEEITSMEEKTRQEADILIARLNAAGLKPITVKEYEQRHSQKEKKKENKRKYFRRGLVVAAVMVVVLVGGISAVAKSEYHYDQYPGTGGGSAIIRYNTAVDFSKDELDRAYDQIGQSLEIPVMVLGYTPEGMLFYAAEVDKVHVSLKFVYREKSIFLSEDKSIEEKTLATTESDRKSCTEVHNEWIDRLIQIEENKLENGDIEYSANIKGDGAFYYLSGVMEKEEFIKMVENLYYQ